MQPESQLRFPDSNMLFKSFDENFDVIGLINENNNNIRTNKNRKNKNKYQQNMYSMISFFCVCSGGLRPPLLPPPRGLVAH